MHFHYNKPPAASPYLCWIFLRRVGPGCSSKSKVSPPGRPHRFHKPNPTHSAPGKPAMALGHLTKGATWEELIQACLQSFGKSGCSFEIITSLSGQSLCITDRVWHVISALAGWETVFGSRKNPVSVITISLFLNCFLLRSKYTYMCRYMVTLVSLHICNTAFWLV